MFGRGRDPDRTNNPADPTTIAPGLDVYDVAGTTARQGRAKARDMTRLMARFMAWAEDRHSRNTVMARVKADARKNHTTAYTTRRRRG